MVEIDQIKQLLKECDREQRQEIFEYLLSEFPIHPIEKELNVQARVILEAINRSNDLTKRGIRGIITEAEFEVHVISNLTGWKNITPAGNYPFDFLLEDSIGEVKVQLKMQRQKNFIPMMAKEANKHYPNNMYVVETHRTRAGKSREGEGTRPYRFGDFDILAVSMQPSTRRWDTYYFTVSEWLIPDPLKPTNIFKFQPIPSAPNEDWTNDLRTCIEWFRSRHKKTISGKFLVSG